MLTLPLIITVFKQSKMDLQKFLTEAGVLVVGGVATVTAGYYLIKDDIKTYFRLKFSEQQKDKENPLLSLRLQAH